MTYGAGVVIPAASRRASKVMPFQRVSNLDHLVTQWMSTEVAVDGRASIASQDQEASVFPASSWRESDQLEVGILGVGPAESTGKSRVSYCPGGRRSRVAGSC